MTTLNGLGVALVTPFNSDGSIDFAALEKLVEFNSNGGTDYLVVLGTTGESATLSKEEKKQVIECIKKINNKKLPLILGIGGNNTAEVIHQIKETDLTDFIAVLSVSPYYNKPTQEGIFQHYKAISEASPKPIVVYNVPGRTGSNITSATTVRISKELNNVIAIKEACPNFLQSTEIIKEKPENFSVVSGDDELALAITLAGGKGVISVIGQAFPELFSKMIHLGLERKVDQAYQLHYKFVNITRLIFAEGNPAGIKAVLSELGICKPYTRLPLVPASKELTDKIKKEIEKIK